MTGWRTVIFGSLLALAGFLQGVNWLAVIPNNPQAVGIITGVIGVAIVGLRMVTTTPIGTPKP